MMWSVKTQFTDRRTGVAAIVAAATEHGMALMGLRTSPGWGGLLVDEFVLAVPGGWDAARIEAALLAWGAATVRATPVDADRPAAHEEAGRRARVAHPAGAGRTWRSMPAAS